MKVLIPLSTMLAALQIWSCASEKKVPPKDPMGDEEYRVISATLIAQQTRRNEGRHLSYFGDSKSKDSAEIVRDFAAFLADFDAEERKYAIAPWCAEGPLPDRRFYDSVAQKYGPDAYYIVRSGGKCGFLYDSLLRKYGDLSYYMTVNSETTAFDSLNSPIFYDKAMASRVTPDLVRSFNHANSRKHVLDDRRFTDSLIVELFAIEDFDSTLTPREWWPAFYERYPLSNGTISVSRVGFNSDTTVALIWVMAVSAPRSGVGYYSVLEKEDGRWFIFAEQTCIQI